ncbi:hypothetical protein [Actinoplanes sp. M2I2]|uniref:hypothetical protein n=1 Tax=Actinoplanes sp. M2I2 TaxID=1734444 RepID=UPI0020227618|nr:hypothetical protein [Actinoplanes sp. M2I2]
MSDVDEYGRMSPEGAKSYWWLRIPWWVRGAVAGLFFGTAMFIVSWASDDDPDSAGELVGAAASAVLFGIVFGLLMRSQERRMFEADGQVLSPEERIMVVRSVDAGRWPDDARLYPGARRLVDQKLRRRLAPAVEIAVFGLMLAMFVLKAVLNGPWWWLAVVFWAIVGPWSMRNTRRSRAAAQSLRDVGEPRGSTT